MYIVINPNNCSGMGSYIWQALRCIYSFPNYKYYILFTNCLYTDSSEKNIDNPFEYYFVQPHPKPKRSEIDKIVSLIDTPESEYRDVFMLNPTVEDIQQKRNEYNSIIQSYLQLTQEIKNKINDFYQREMKDQRVLGVHIRGTDHPDKKENEQIIATLDNIANDYEKIFIATDEQERLDFFKHRYGNKVIYYNSLRSETNGALHTNPRLNSDQRRRIGEEVIIESYLLSKCNFLGLATNSNINYLARAINPTVQYTML